MLFNTCRLRLFATGIVGALIASVPATTQAAPEVDQTYPSCSATVTDHCMQRGGSGMHGMTKGHHHRNHHRH
jgi:hypothetical protein